MMVSLVLRKVSVVPMQSVLFAILSIVGYHEASLSSLCAIDLSKAFDKVNHHVLFIKLMHRNIPAQILELIQNLFTDCSACVKWGQSWSSDFIIHFRLLK